MSNILTPGSTSLTASGKKVTLTTTVEYNAGLATTQNRTPLINLLASQMPYNQMIEFTLEVPANADGANLWEAPDSDLGAKAVVVTCEAGGGAVVINPGTGSLLFPIIANPTLGNGFFMYANPSGYGITIGATETGPGIQKLAVSTLVESRFNVYIFI